MKIKIPIQTFDMSTAALEAMFPVNVCGWLVLDRAPDPEVLREAVKGTLREFPAMACGIRPGWIKSRFVPSPSNEPPLTIVDHGRADPESIPEPLLEFFKTPLDMYKGPLANFCLVRAENFSFLGIKTHHGACDGRGHRHLLEALADRYSTLARGEKPTRPEFRIDRVPNIIYKQYPLSKRLRLMTHGLKFFIFSMFEEPVDTLDVPTEGDGAFSSVFFKGNESAQIISKCKSQGITVNDLFTAALARTFYRWNGKAAFVRFLIPQDLRPWGVSSPEAHLEQGEWRTVGNVLGGLFCSLMGTELDDPLRVRELVHERIQAEKDAESALAFASLATLPINLFPMKPCMAIYRRIDPGKVFNDLLHISIVFSNLGTVPPGRLAFGDARPLHFAFALPYVEGTGVLFTAAGVGDSISFVATHPKDMDHERLMAIFKEELMR